MLTKTLDLYIKPDAENESGFVYFVVDPTAGYRWADNHDIKIGQVEVSFDVPDNLSEDDLRRKAIETLKEKQQQIRAQAYKDIERIQERIDQMLLLTHQPEPISGEIHSVQ